MIEKAAVAILIGLFIYGVYLFFTKVINIYGCSGYDDWIP